MIRKYKKFGVSSSRFSEKEVLPVASSIVSISFLRQLQGQLAKLLVD